MAPQRRCAAAHTRLRWSRLHLVRLQPRARVLLRASERNEHEELAETERRACDVTTVTEALPAALSVRHWSLPRNHHSLSSERPDHAGNRPFEYPQHACVLGDGRACRGTITIVLLSSSSRPKRRCIAAECSASCIESAEPHQPSPPAVAAKVAAKRFSPIASAAKTARSSAAPSGDR